MQLRCHRRANTPGSICTRFRQFLPGIVSSPARSPWRRHADGAHLCASEARDCFSFRRRRRTLVLNLLRDASIERDIPVMGGEVRVIRKRPRTVVVVGNGMVGHRFCERLVEFDAAGEYRIVTFAEEPRAAYDRVNLTK